MKIRIHVPAWSREVEITDQPTVVESTIPITLTVLPSGPVPPVEPVEPTPTPPPIDFSVNLPHATDFLAAGARTHTYAGRTPADRTRILTLMRDRRYTHLYVYAYNERDYGGPSFDYLRAPQAFRPFLEEIRAAGLKPIVWLFPDDAPKIHETSESELKGLLSRFIPVVDDLVTSYVLGLELDEYWEASRVDQLGRHLNTLTAKPLATHQTSGHYNFGKFNWVDYHVHQYLKENRTLSGIGAETQKVLRVLGKPVVAGEYEVNKEATAVKLGNAAVSGGASGFGNGGTPPGPVPPPVTGPPYHRWLDAGVTTESQVTGIYREQLGRTPTAGQLAFEMSLRRTPAQLWFLLQDNPEWARTHPGQTKHPAPPSLEGGGP